VDVHGGAPHRAYAVTALVGDVAVGDDVVINTTAVDSASAPVAGTSSTGT
jgi:hypothetical protein